MPLSKDLGLLVVGALTVSAVLLFAAKVCVVHLEESEVDRVRGIDLPAIRQALDAYRRKTGHMPEALTALVVSGLAVKMPTDPWEREYVYQRRDGRVRIASLGKDGLVGGEGLDADIDCWISDTAPEAPSSAGTPR